MAMVLSSQIQKQDFEFSYPSLESVVREFLYSPEARYLNDVYELDQIEARLLTIGQLMYRHYHQSYRNWSSHKLRFGCLELLPTYLLETPEAFQEISDMMQAFIQFLGAEGYIEHADSCLQALYTATSDMLMRAADPNCWGMEKLFVLATLKPEYLELLNRGKLSMFADFYQSHFEGITNPLQGH